MFHTLFTRGSLSLVHLCSSLVTKYIPEKDEQYDQFEKMCGGHVAG